MADEVWAGLAEAIGAIRDELQRAEIEGRDKPVRFRTGPVELEFTVDVRKDAEGRARVSVLPFGLGAEAKAAASRGTTNRIALTLHPVDAEGRDKRIADTVPAPADGASGRPE
ncbi:trypco2 family protein [Streptomyces sp. NPDC008125]|uniref:trypco2 family protein n=1 Tax=Streptomyces sp. NPDC008125 TaxID=3364811 RepID=UPI0036E136F8